MIESSDVQRLANLAGAFALAATDRLSEAATEASGRPTSDTAALVLLSGALDGASQHAVGEALGLTQTGAVRLVDRLVATGMVERQPGPDARTHALAATTAGRRAADDAMRSRTATLVEMLDVLTVRERTQLTDLLERMLGEITAGRAEARRICRLCDIGVCGHRIGRCPVTQAADRAEEAGSHGGAR